jgi:NADH dehydrogenase (ubiquinone) 1 beta subcomplex subunit 8
VHEDNDILGMFSTYEYTHMSPQRGLVMWAGFIGVIFGLYYICKATYPDMPAVPKEYEGGLFEELGGKGAVRVSLVFAVVA